MQMCETVVTGKSIDDQSLAIKSTLEEAKKCRDRAFNAFVDEFYPYAKGRFYYPIIFSNSVKLYSMPRCDDPSWNEDLSKEEGKARTILVKTKLKRLQHLERKHEPIVEFLVKNCPISDNKLWFLDHVETLVNEDKHHKELFMTAEDTRELFHIAHRSAAFSEKVMEFFVHYIRDHGTGELSILFPDMDAVV
jgi:hypothetical protein